MKEAVNTVPSNILGWVLSPTVAITPQTQTVEPPETDYKSAVIYSLGPDGMVGDYLNTPFPTARDPRSFFRESDLWETMDEELNGDDLKLIF